MARFRPRFTFSLRSLFIVLTILTVALGWQWRSIHERRAVVSWMRKNASMDICLMGSKSWRGRLLSAYNSPEPSWFRRLLGDKRLPGGLWVFHRRLRDSEIARMKQAFPEVSFDSLSDREDQLSTAFDAREPTR